METLQDKNDREGISQLDHFCHRSKQCIRQGRRCPFQPTCDTLCMTICVVAVIAVVMAVITILLFLKIKGKICRPTPPIIGPIIPVVKSSRVVSWGGDDRLFFQQILDASTNLKRRIFPSVGPSLDPSVYWSIYPSVRPSIDPFIRTNASFFSIVRHMHTSASVHAKASS